MERFQGRIKSVNLSSPLPRNPIPELSRRSTRGQAPIVTRMIETARCVVLGIIPRNCPGTVQYRRRYQRLIVAAARKRRQRLLVLQQSGLDENRTLRTQLRHHQNRLAAIQIWQGMIANLSGGILLGFAVMLWPAMFYAPS